MLYEFKNEIGGNFVYWSNSCGDLHHNGEYDIEKVEGLPRELQRAFNELWCEGIYGVRCYLVEFNGEYGIAFEAGYDKCYADYLEIELEELVKIAKEKANECSNRYSEYDVIFGKYTEERSDRTTEAIIMIVMPWDVNYESFDEVGKYFEAMCYAVSK